MTDQPGVEALAEYRSRIEEEDPAVIRLQKTDPFVVASIFAQGFNAGQDSHEHRAVASVSELDALPADSIVMFGDGDVWRTVGRGGYIKIPANDPDWMSTAEYQKYPATVLWVGGTE